MFLDPRSRDFYIEWAAVAKDVVAALRIEGGRNPYDRGLTDLIGELSTRSDEFRTWWASRNVRLHRTSTKQMHHPVAGELELTGAALVLPGDAGLTLITYTVEPATSSAQALQFLASWASDRHPPAPSRRADRPGGRVARHPHEHPRRGSTHGPNTRSRDPSPGGHIAAKCRTASSTRDSSSPVPGVRASLTSWMALGIRP